MSVCVFLFSVGGEMIVIRKTLKMCNFSWPDAFALTVCILQIQFKIWYTVCLLPISN